MRITTLAFAGIALIALSVPASALSLNLVDTAAEDAAFLAGAVLAPGSGISIIGGSEVFVGRTGLEATASYQPQSATYTGLSLVPSMGGYPTITNPDGIFLTSGVGNVPFTNTDTSFDNLSIGGIHPGTGSDADLVAILVAAGAPSSTVNDVNYLSFSFTVAAGITSVEADFVFGSDEFPDQAVTDVFAFIVDGVNYAFFPDGSLVSFVEGVNAGYFVNNNTPLGTGGGYSIEYDGFSQSLHVVGLLDPTIADGGVHTIKIAIADTSDQIFDSGVFIGNLIAGEGEDPGIDVDPIVPEPGSIALLGLGLAGLGVMIRRRRRIR